MPDQITDPIPAHGITVGPVPRRSATGGPLRVALDELARHRLTDPDYAPVVDCERQADGSYIVNDRNGGLIVLAAKAGDDDERTGMVRCRLPTLGKGLGHGR